MIKKITILLLLLLMVAMPVGILFTPTTAFAQADQSCAWYDAICNLKDKAVQPLLGALVSAFNFVFGNISNGILLLTSWFTWFSGVLLNISILLTIFQADAIISNMDAITDGWTLFRDIANIAFIFILLYIAIATILELGVNTGKLIMKVIIAALLINFSFFFTTLIIDTSNILTVSIYKQISAAGQSANFDPQQITNNGLSGAVMAKLDLASIYEIPSGNGAPDAKDFDFFGALGNVLVRTVGGVLLLLTAALVFFVAATMFIVRFVVFIFLLITSPVAFVAAILPKTSAIAQRWWKSLMNQAIFAPVFMLLLLISIELIGSFGDLVNSGATGLSTNGASMATALNNSSGSVGAAVVLLTPLIGFAFLIGTIVISKMAGGLGGDWATKVGGRAIFGGLAFAGRQTGGRLGRRIADSETLKDTAENGNVFTRNAARLTLRAGDSAKKATYDYSSAAGGAASSLSGAIGGGKVDFGKSVTRKDLDKKQEEAEKAAMKRLETSPYEISQREQALQEATQNPEKAEEMREKKLKEIDEKTRSYVAKNLAKAAKTKDPKRKEKFQKRVQQATEDLKKYESRDSYLKHLQTRVDRAKGVDEKEAIKRVGKQRKWESKDMYRQRVESAKVKSETEERKEKRVENIQNASMWSKIATLRSKRDVVERTELAKKARQGKKSTKDLLSEFAKAEGLDVTDSDQKDDSTTKNTQGPNQQNT